MMEMIMEVFLTLVVYYELGFTSTGQVSRHRNRVPHIREDATEEELRAVVATLRPAMAGKITGVDLERVTVKKVWTPEMRREKLKKEGEELETNQGQGVMSVQTVQNASGANAAPVQAMNAATAIMARKRKARPKTFLLRRFLIHYFPRKPAPVSPLAGVMRNP